MNPAERYLEYAGAFEQTYDDDDWNRLEPFFTPDAIFSSTGGPPLGGRWEGRAEVLSQLRESVDQLDRRFDKRSVELIGEPEIGENTFLIRWRATYSLSGCPDLVFVGSERATFEGDQIRLLEDETEEGVDTMIREYQDRHHEALGA